MALMNIVINVTLWIVYILSLYFSVFLFLIFIDKKNFFSTEESSINLAREPYVSVFVPAYNEEKTIVKTLQSIDNLDYPHEKIEVIVIDDGSKDRTRSIIEEHMKDKPNYRMISRPNKGKAASLNDALKAANGEFFACLDADSFVHRDTLRKMLALYEKENDERLAIITPAMKVHDPKTVLEKIQWLEYLVIILISRISSHLDSLYVAPGPFSLYRTEIIRKIGGFDETSITEDQEIAYRVQKENYRIKQCFDGYVFTTAPSKLKPFYRQRRRWYLGSIICLHQYKEMVANRKYGDFGMMQMIKNVAGYLLATAGIFIAVYLFIIPAWNYLKSGWLIRFEIMPILKNLDFSITMMDLLTIDFKRTFIIISLFMIGFYFFYQAHKNANEKVMKFGIIPLLPYFLFYYLLKGIILLMSLTKFTAKQKLRW